MKKSFVDKNGKVVAIEIDDIDLEIKPDYEQFVSELIREKYSLDDEFSLNSKSMQIYFNNCTEEQLGKWSTNY